MNSVFRKVSAIGLSLLIMASSAVPTFALNRAQLLNDSKDLLTKSVKTVSAKVRFAPRSADGYWSSQFSRDGQTAYERFVDAVSNFESSVDIPNISQQERGQFAQIIQQEHPELFYVSGIGAKIHQDSDGYKWQEMTISYLPNARTKKAAVESAARQFLNGAPTNGSDYDKELFVHDKLVNQTTYQRGQKSIYNNLVEHKSNCMGYAYAMKYLLNQLGVTCRVCIGTATGEGDHMWNVVTLNGKEYLTDTGWDDPSGITQHALSHRYFNLTKEQMNVDHQPKNPKEENACINTDQSYYKKNGMYYSSVDAAEKAIQEALKTQKVAQVQLPNTTMAAQVRQDFMDGKIVNAKRGAEKDVRQNGVVNGVVVVYLN